eukprot:2647180-Rhodomonas_salina.1
MASVRRKFFYHRESSGLCLIPHPEIKSNGRRTRWRRYTGFVLPSHAALPRMYRLCTNSDAVPSSCIVLRFIGPVCPGPWLRVAASESYS